MIQEEKVKLDEIDLEILKLLSIDSTSSNTSIANKLEKHPTTISNHVEELKKKGIIQGFTIKIDYEKLGFDIISLIEITVSKGKMLDVEQEIAQNPNVFAVYDVTGQYDALILARFKNRKELSKLVKDINSLSNVKRTNTHLILNIIKDGADFSELISSTLEK
ncbi:MAG: Lrp/AsnC family transcriptional regulator [Promethearchaeota archaeon]|nr:MAG: Lrp/AsnC family transcriptional regulator [Candidatus Lokiarchaeota archaeon]